MKQLCFNTKFFLHQIVGLMILPMKRIFSVLRSRMMTINGRSNFKTGVKRIDISLIPTPVAAAAVAPASSTSRVAWCTTCSTLDTEWEVDRLQGRKCASSNRCSLSLPLRLPVFDPLKCHSDLHDHQTCRSFPFQSTHPSAGRKSWWRTLEHKSCMS